MKISILTLIATFVVGCGSSSPPPVVDEQPLGEVGSGIKRTICIEISRDVNTVDWRIHDMVVEWNKNKTNILTTDVEAESCDGTVLISAVPTNQWCGSTEFYPRDLVHVQLNNNCALDKHRAIICHELGHVLGLLHSSNDGSCMDPQQANPLPTPADISVVGKEMWEAPVIANRLRGTK
jgi:hypothetical protein